MSRELHRYHVERVSRCVVNVEVEAYTAKEARQLAAQGEGNSQDAAYEARGTGRVERLDPMTDRMRELVSRDRR